MIGIILAAGYATRMYPLTRNTPKPLLEIGGKSILSRMFEDMRDNCGLSRQILVSNHRFIGAFEAWKAAGGYAVDLLDDGSTENENRIGAVRDLQLAVNAIDQADDLLICAADNLLDFSLRALVDAFHARQKTSILCYLEPDIEKRRRSGVLTLSEDHLVTGFEEKPENPVGTHVAPPFYIVAKRDVPLIRRALDEGINPDAPGSLIGYLYKQSRVYALEMPGKRYDVGNLETYQRLKSAPPIV